MERPESHGRTVAVLCGGVGAARFLSGLVHVIAPADVSAIVNVADDEVVHGLYVSPDLDTVLYTLAGLVDEERGWGIRGDSFVANAALGRFGQDTWFQLGDADLATHIRRTELLRGDIPLSAVTAELAGALGVLTHLLPATDAPQRTVVRTAAGWLRFQDYFVRRRAADTVLEVRFDGVAAPGPGVLAALASAALIVIAPSNPIVSIGPLLALDGMRETLMQTDVPIIAISPIVGGAAIKGPAAEMLASLGHEVSPVGVARLYADFIDALILDEADAALAPAVERLGISAVVAPTIMHDAAAREQLARITLDAAQVLT